MSKSMDWNQNFIRDGFTQDGYIAAVERRHGFMRFKFRPMLPEEVEEFDVFRNENILKPRQVVERMAKEVASRLTAWSEEADGKPVEISPLNLRRVRHPMLVKLYGVLAGERASDEDPEYKKLEDAGFEPLSSADPVEQLGN